jgi:hypothetical protein
VLAYAARQLGIGVSAFDDYARRDATRRSHLAEALRAGGYSAFDRTAARAAVDFLTASAQIAVRPGQLAGILVDELRRRRILRTFENQAYRASGLNLVVAAVILWNTRYLQLAADDLGVRAESMHHVAPLGWEHLSLTGDYAWGADDQPAPGELRPLRAKPSILAA